SPRRDPRGIEQIVDEPRQMLQLPLDHPAELVELLVGRQTAEQLRRGHQRCERVAQLVREQREELVLAPIRALELLLGELPFRDVDDRADIALELAAGTETRSRRLQHP